MPAHKTRRPDNEKKSIKENWWQKERRKFCSSAENEYIFRKVFCVCFLSKFRKLSLVPNIWKLLFLRRQSLKERRNKSSRSIKENCSTMMWGKVFHRKTFRFSGPTTQRSLKFSGVKYVGEKIALLDYCLMSRKLKLCRLWFCAKKDRLSTSSPRLRSKLRHVLNYFW